MYAPQPFLNQTSILAQNKTHATGTVRYDRGAPKTSEKAPHLSSVLLTQKQAFWENLSA